MVFNIIFHFCCTRKMLKETETEETIGFFATFLSLVAHFNIGYACPPPPAKPMIHRWAS